MLPRALNVKVSSHRVYLDQQLFYNITGESATQEGR